MISSDPQQAASLYISNASLKCFHCVTHELDRGQSIQHCLARESFPKLDEKLARVEILVGISFFQKQSLGVNSLAFWR
ncbi:hypothetical protein IQ249_17115 [Lusitaniella coriacea LEGE 07157]|uniref:Uncharacterized protein n=1 Tax=Lusitaniella coriacea LEGE 07157 TaxID=945747 RepID=A0A8J7DY66_9CYAN|nr:hypothetical protein [Lusitaniella coriacea]MBE9117621.1 hypothetical protein [Lusitaniella coriacea LEGE 07157]